MIVADLRAIDTLSTDIGPAYIEKIAPYLALCTHTHEINSDHEANRAISKLSEGLSLVSSYVGAASYLYTSSKYKRKQAEARAALDKAPQHFFTSGVTKPSVAQTEHFVNLDPDVEAAMDKENMAEAMLAQLNIIKMNLIMSLSSIKASRYGFKEDGQVSGSLV